MCGCLGKPVGSRWASFWVEQKKFQHFFSQIFFKICLVMGTLVENSTDTSVIFYIYMHFLPKIAVTKSGLSTDIPHVVSQV
jgi:hypothetical protein